MNKKVLLIGMLFCTAAIYGCATPSTKLQNASGQVVDCSASGWGLVGTPLAIASHSDCLNKAQAAGYRAVNKESIAPKPSAEAAKVDLALPEEWERKPLTENMANGGASVFASNKTTGTSVLVSVASREGVTDLMAFAMSRRANQESKLLNPQSTEITQRDINGRQAFRYEVSGYVKGGLKITYLSTIIVGAEQLVMVSTWAKAIDYPQNKEQLEGLASKLTGLS